MKSIIVMVQIHHVVFAPVTFPRAAVLNFFFFVLFFWGFFELFFSIATFWYSSIPWELFNCFTSFFYICSWYYSEGYLTKETFLQYLPFWREPFWGTLELILGCAPLFFRAVPHLILWNCLQILFHITLRVNVLRKISQHRSLCFGNYAKSLGLCWIYSSMSWET